MKKKLDGNKENREKEMLGRQTLPFETKGLPKLRGVDNYSALNHR